MNVNGYTGSVGQKKVWVKCVKDLNNKGNKVNTGILWMMEMIGRSVHTVPTLYKWDKV